ncbi:MAG: DUF805 domain-containing protein [Paludibacteraceae bacterium]|nr:DUF805 domain-containing protein [Paludibacteraceae bacterium]
MIDNFKKVVCDNYANFSGRARRSEYWMYLLAYWVISVVLGFILGVVGGIFGLDQQLISVPIYVLGIALLLPSLAVAVRRLHDTDKSGWYLLVTLIPLIGGILFLVWAVSEGTAGPNKYGEDPKKSKLFD